MLFSRTLLFTVIGLTMAVSSTAEAGYIKWPVSGRVSSDYGPRTSPCSGCSNYHHGIDIAVGSGTILGAPANGTVASYAWNSCSGNVYSIGYGNGWQTRFHHTSGQIVGAGNAVSANQNVAYSGGTGSCTTGPHLHFEVRKDGVSQLVPGAVNSYVTRNTQVPQYYAGLNDTPPPPPTAVYSARPSVLSIPDGRLALFQIGSGGAVFFTWQNTVGGSFVNPWANLGGAGFTQVQGYYNAANGCFMVLGIGNGTALWQRCQLTQGGAWGNWTQVGTTTFTNFDAILMSNGMPFVFGVGGGGVVVYNSQSTWNGSWAGWTDLGAGAGFTKTKAFVDANGAIAMVGVGPGTPVWWKSQVSGGGAWGPMVNLSGTLFDLDITAMNNGSPAIFAIGENGTLWSKYRKAGVWTGWITLDGAGFGWIDAVNNPNFGPTVVGFGAYGSILHKAMNQGTEAWTDWAGLGEPYSSVSIIYANSGVGAIYGRGKFDTVMYGRSQGSIGGPWGSTVNLGCCFN